MPPHHRRLRRRTPSRHRTSRSTRPSCSTTRKHATRACPRLEARQASSAPVTAAPAVSRHAATRATRLERVRRPRAYGGPSSDLGRHGSNRPPSPPTRRSCRPALRAHDPVPGPPAPRQAGDRFGIVPRGYAWPATDRTARASPAPWPPTSVARTPSPCCRNLRRPAGTPSRSRSDRPHPTRPYPLMAGRRA